MPLAEKTSSNSLTLTLSPFVSSNVTTSFGCVSNHRLITWRYASKLPASLRKQEVWQRLSVPKMFRWVCACKNRTPASSWVVTSTSWSSVGRIPTNAESWVAIWVMFEYLRSQSSTWPLQPTWAWLWMWINIGAICSKRLMIAIARIVVHARNRMV